MVVFQALFALLVSASGMPTAPAVGEDARCFWVATFASRSLLATTRKSTGSAKELHDMCLTDELRDLFGRAATRSNFRDLAPSECHMLGAVAIAPRQRYSHQSSDALGDEVRHQISHWTILAGRPLHGFALLFEVRAATLLEEPQVWFTFSGRRGGSFFTELEAGQEQRLRTVLPQDSHPVFRYPFLGVLRIPHPYAMFFLKGFWKTVVVPDLATAWNHDAYGVSKGRKFVAGLVGAQRKRQQSWPAIRRFGDRPALADADAAREVGSAKQVDVIHDCGKLWGLADCVAALGQGLVSEIDPQVWKDFVEGFRYQHAEGLLLASQRHAYVAGGRESFSFQIGHLVETMLCSMSLSNDDDLAQALQLAACLLLPEKLAQSWITRLREDCRKYMPSKAIISQRRAALDMGYACLQQEWVKQRLEQQAFFYALTDSSPQGGRDYEVTVLDVVRAQDATDLLLYVFSARQCPGSKRYGFSHEVPFLSYCELWRRR